MPPRWHWHPCARRAVRALVLLPCILLAACTGAPAFPWGAPDPSPTPVTGPPAFGLAWFHKPPEDGTTAATLAANARYIHLTGPSDVAFRTALRQAGFQGPIYTYTSAMSVEGPGPYKNAAAPCTPGYAPRDNTLAWRLDDFCTSIHPHESWFLHNSAGDRLVDDYFGVGRWTYLMNPADPGWRAFAAARLREIQTSWGYDGIWLDNLDLDRNRALQGVTNSDGGLREYATTAAWQKAVAGWLAQVRGALGPTPLWANLVGGDLAQDGWDAYAPYLDGAMEESFAVSWLQGWRTDEEWRADESRAEAWLAQGKGLVLVGQGPQDDLERMRFTLASYMLVAQGDRTSFRYTRYDSYYMGWWWYPDYAQALALGPPIGIRHEVQPGVWQREFAHGRVEVNLTTHTGRIVPAADGGGS